MLSLRVVHNFVNKFLKCSARLCVRGVSLSTHPSRGPRRLENGRRRIRARGAPALSFPPRCGYRRARGGTGRVSHGPADSFRGRATAATGPAPCRTGIPASPSKLNLPRQVRGSLNRAVIFFFFFPLNILIFSQPDFGSASRALRDPAPSRPD